MATTQNTFNGDGSNLGPFSFTFKWLESTDIKVSVGGVLKTAGTHYNLQGLNYTTKTGGQVLFIAGNAPPIGTGNVRVYRDTDDDVLSATFSSGSAIRAKDLNDNFTQNLYVTQEVNNNAVNIDGSNPMVGNLNMNGFQIDNLAAPTSANDAANKAYVDALAVSGGDGDKGDITVSGLGSVFTIDNNAITNAKVNGSAGIVSSKLAFTQAGTNAIQRTVESKLQDVVSVLDFIPDSEHAAIKAGTSTYDATAAIQAALNTGKDVYLPSGGTYRVSGVIVTSQRLFGGGTIKKIAGNPFALHLLGRNVSVDNIQFNAETQSGQPNTDIKVGDGADGVSISGCYFGGASGGSIYSAIGTSDNEVGDYPYAVNIDGLRISNNTFKGYSRPVYLFCVNNYSITGNSFSDTLYDAIRIREAIGEGIISSNTFHNIGSPAILTGETQDCIDTASSGRNLIISNNVMKTCNYAGIDIKGLGDRTYSSRNIIISGNHIEDMRYSGISCYFSTDFQYNFSVTGNTIIGCNREYAGVGNSTFGAVLIQNNIRYVNISDNFIAGNYSRGISITRNDALLDPPKYVLVSGNTTINNGTAGIFLGNLSGAVVTGNFSGNSTDTWSTLPADPILPQTTNQSNGYILSSCSDIVFTNNIAHDNNSNPITATPEQFAVYSNNRYIGTNSEFTGNVAERWALSQKKLLRGTGVTPNSSTGTFQQGDVILRNSPTSGNPVGLVCVADGTPGTWEPFGLVGQGSAIGGWGTPTGTVSRNTFVSDTVTLVGLAARVAQLITDLKTMKLLKD